MDDTGGDMGDFPGFEQALFGLDPLFDAPLQHINNLLEFGVSVKVVAFARWQDGPAKLKIFGFGDFRTAQPVVCATFVVFLKRFTLGNESMFGHKRVVEIATRSGGRGAGGVGHFFRFISALAAGALRLLNRRVRSVKEASTPMRSRELAPTNPTASVAFRTRSASSGVLIGPP